MPSSLNNECGMQADSSQISYLIEIDMKKNKGLARGIAIGIGIGTAIGVATDNLGLWLAVGIAIGAGIGTTLNQKNKSDKNNT